MLVLTQAPSPSEPLTMTSKVVYHPLKHGKVWFLDFHSVALYVKAPFVSASAQLPRAGWFHNGRLQSLKLNLRTVPKLHMKVSAAT